MTADAAAGTRAVVMGLGLFGGGVAAARYLARRGARVTVTDLRDAEALAPALAELEGLDARFVLGRHEEPDFRTAQLVVVNPAVPPRAPLVALAREHGARITSEAGLFLDRVRAPVLAVTGTQGKSSTCRFLADLLAGSGRRVRLGGNIGRPLLAEVDAIEPDEICVLELSSYQLETLPDDVSRGRDESPLAVGAITNVLADHLERHGTRSDYAAAKLRLLELLPPGSTFLRPADADWAPAALPAGVRALAFDAGGGSAPLNVEGDAFRFGEQVLASIAAAPPLPDFQRANLLVALGAARLAGVEPEALASALPGVRGLPHRLADLGVRGGRRVWDNAVSTTPDSTVSALRALAPGPTLLAGGKVKDLDTAELVAVAAERAALVVLFGEAGHAWPARFRAAGVDVRTVRDVPAAVDAAWAPDAPSGPVLFSPACASFDAYPNFRARAEHFHALLPPAESE